MTNERSSQDRDVRRAVLRIWGPLGLVTILAFAVALRFVGAPPPERVTIATGPAGGGYAAAGEAFAEALREAGIDAALVATRGSSENLERLRAGDVDVALVQGGLARDDEPELAGVVSLYLEPLWVFAKEPVTRLDALAGRRVDLGAEGSGTRALAERLLDAAGVEVTPAEDGDDAAAAATLRVAAPRSQTVRSLLDAGLVPADLERAEGIARTLTYVQSVRVHEGSIDLEAGLPRGTIDTVAPAATLIAHEDLHPAVVGLLVSAARVRFGGRGVLEDEGEFPSLHLLDVPPSLAARTAVESGPSFLYRVFPFQVAALIDRLWILVLPLLTLLFPLFRVAPPLYRWRIRRRIFRWYARILSLERRLRAAESSTADLTGAARELDQLDEELAGVTVPLSYADELYRLRQHLRMVREDLTEGRGRWAR